MKKRYDHRVEYFQFVRVAISLMEKDTIMTSPNYRKLVGRGKYTFGNTAK